MKRKYIIIILICAFAALSAKEISIKKNIVDRRQQLNNYSKVLKTNAKSNTKKLSLAKILENLSSSNNAAIANIRCEKNDTYNIEIKLQNVDNLISEVNKAENIANFNKVDKIVINDSKTEKGHISLYVIFTK